MKLKWENKYTDGRGYYKFQENQKTYFFRESFINEELTDKNYNFNITVKDFDNCLRMIFYDNIKPLLDISSNENIGYERFFKEKEKIDINMGDIIYILINLINKLRNTTFKSIILFKQLEFRFKLKNNIFSVLGESGKIIYNESLNNNIFNLFYEFFIKRINLYTSYNKNEKIIFLLKKYGIRVDFTKKKFTYAYDSNHIIITKDAELDKIIRFLERGNSIFVECILKYFILYVLANESKIIDLKLSKYVDNNMIPYKISEFIKAFKPAKTRYLIDRIRKLEKVEIVRYIEGHKEIIKFKDNYEKKIYFYNMSFILKNINNLGILLSEGIYERKELKYNYTNSHVVY